jgi:signal transduction histidine kinase
MDDTPETERVLTLRMEPPSAERVRIVIQDKGVGIAPEMLTRIFQYGFTTRSEGHGFGLHSSALAAQELGGTLSAHSDGPNRGATFTLELPYHPTQETR